MSHMVLAIRSGSHDVQDRSSGSDFHRQQVFLRTTVRGCAVGTQQVEGLIAEFLDLLSH
jgi:hypothetical protein